MRTSVLLAIIWFAVGGERRAMAAEVDETKVSQSVAFAVEFLKRQQSQETGGWPEYEGYPGGVSALCTLALLKSGVDRNDEVIIKSLDHLKTLEAPEQTYSNALQIMVFCEAGAMQYEELIVRNARWLENAQLSAGGWYYTNEPRKRSDGSNTQFALLASHEAAKTGVAVKEATWRRAHRYWTKSQNADGSWSYSSSLFESPSGSMTCAGISSLVITADQLKSSKTIRKQSNTSVQRAFDWLAENYALRQNPGTKGLHTFGYLFALGQAGQLAKQRAIGQHDWYREGAEMLIAHQDTLQGFWRGKGVVEENRLITTCYALLFLASQSSSTSEAFGSTLGELRRIDELQTVLSNNQWVVRCETNLPSPAAFATSRHPRDGAEPRVSEAKHLFDNWWYYVGN